MWLIMIAVMLFKKDVIGLNKVNKIDLPGPRSYEGYHVCEWN